MALEEVAHSRVYMGVEEHAWHGERVWICDPDEVYEKEEYLWNTSWAFRPRASGDNTDGQIQIISGDPYLYSTSTDFVSAGVSVGDIVEISNHQNGGDNNGLFGVEEVSPEGLGEHYLKLADAQSRLTQGTCTFAVSENLLSPVKMRVFLQDVLYPGKSRFVVVYETRHNPNPGRWPVRRATMSVHADPDRTKMYQDINGKIIESLPDQNGLFFRPVKGIHFSLEPRTKVIVHTADFLGDIKWNEILGMIGKCNKLTMTNIGNAAPHTMRLLDVRIPKFYVLSENSVIVPLDYEFMYLPQTWDHACQVGRFRKRAIQVPVFHRTDGGDPGDPVYVDAITGEATGNVDSAKMRDILITESVDLPAGDDGYRALAEEADFSELNGRLSWL